MKKILITGASGLIGTELSSFLFGKGYDISHLSRNKIKGKYKSFQWDMKNGYLEPGALDGVEHIIHLAGAGIADRRWTPERKKEIIDSRVKSAELLYNIIAKLDNKPRTFITASAIGYYGAVTSDRIFTENDPSGNDFQAEVCKKWEDAANPFSDLGIRTVKLRFGVVLSPKGGALKKMLLPTKLGIGSGLGTGRQYMPWIHIYDVISIIEKCISEESINGVYNLVSPNHATYNQFARTLANVLSKPFFAPNVPSFMLKLVFGEMAQIILEGSRVSSRKIIDSGYKFKYPELAKALVNLLSE